MLSVLVAGLGGRRDRVADVAHGPVARLKRERTLPRRGARDRGGDCAVDAVVRDPRPGTVQDHGVAVDLPLRCRDGSTPAAARGRAETEREPVWTRESPLLYLIPGRSVEEPDGRAVGRDRRSNRRRERCVLCDRGKPERQILARGIEPETVEAVLRGRDIDSDVTGACLEAHRYRHGPGGLVLLVRIAVRPFGVS